MNSAHSPLRIVIVGGGTAGWMAAAAISKIMASVTTVTLVESEEIGSIGVGEATIPQIRTFNAALGLDEAAFVRATNGSYKLGIRFEGWGGPGRDYLHAFGPIGVDLGDLPFWHYWLRSGGRDRPFSDLWRYSLNAVAAAQDRYGPLERVGNTRLPGPVHAFHFDASLYARFLRDFAEARGVARVEGRIVEAARDGESGDLTHVTLADGRVIAGDFFIDCSGFQGLLIERTLAAGYEDWTDLLPCDRAVAAPSSHAPGPLAPYTRAIADRAGWQWRIPLQHRMGAGYVFCSRFTSEDEASARLLATLPGAPLADPRVIRFTTGVRRAHWVSNCVAIGLAAGFLEPLESTSIHLIQSGIARLLTLFPGRGDHAQARAAYNRQTRAEFVRVRDFLILHYWANARNGEPFWDERRAAPLTDTLAERVALFAECGALPREADDLFLEGSWLQVLVGQGIVPAAYHPRADAIAPETLRAFLDDLARVIDTAATALPDHAAHLAALGR